MSPATTLQPRPQQREPAMEDPPASASAIGEVLRRGEFHVWICGAALAVCLLMIAGLLLIVAINGAGFFWPHSLTQADLKGGGQILGVVTRTEKFRKFSGTNNAVSIVTRSQFKVGNRDFYGADFRWIEHSELSEWKHPPRVIALEREEYGDFYGVLRALKEDGQVVAEGDAAWSQFSRRHEAAREIARRRLHVQKVEVGEVNTRIL